MRTITIHQPNFLPWIGFFHKIFQADEIIFLTNVEFSSTNYQNRCYIYGTNNEPSRLTVPVKKKPNLLSQKLIDSSGPNRKWKKNHLTQIHDVYKHAPYYTEIFPLIADIYSQEHTSLVTLNSALIKMILDYLGYKGNMSTDVAVTDICDKTERLVQLVKQAEGTTYLSGSSGRNYLKIDLFEENAIEVQFQNFNHPIYTAKHGESNLLKLSMLDWIMYEAPDSIAVFLEQGKE
ncbi:WbqC family protein [Listeria booriae]|uniref:WbqC family protein n=1 Tax=Listeria booriae TaxID=1552123 RepID=A0A842B4L7_9LIST|nr:WbqC family protein [Listeria booriae]MBC1796862.1 WbqC family protein [Listeria booriae]